MDFADYQKLLCDFICEPVAFMNTSQQQGHRILKTFVRSRVRPGMTSFFLC
ncbi:MAG: hypothetical protein JWP12_1720 [Bacteroidetes bacterium]|nr:hypothetical protein [Bacteroidota bacterium]